MQTSRSRACFASIVCVALPALVVGCGGGTSDATIGGTISGLGTGQSVVVQDNGGDNVTLSANGSFAFPTQLSSGTPYNVTILTQPTGAVCVVAGGIGSVDSSGDNVASVAIACTADSSLGGTVTGLVAGAAVTLTNGSVLLPVAVNGSFAFPGLLENGTSYTVTVATQPVGQTCAIANGVGTVSAASLTAITVTCS
jgi:hypothetical protein